MKKQIRYSNFEQIGITLEHLVKSANLAGKLKKHNLSKVWGQVVGKRFEERSYPASLSNKVLRVACENAQITSELTMSKRMVMQKLQPLAQAIELDIKDIIFSHKIWNPSDKM